MDEEFVDTNDLYEDDANTTSNQPNITRGKSNDSLYRAIGYLVAAIAIVSCYFIFGFGNSDSSSQQTNLAEKTPPVTPPATSAGSKTPNGVEIVTNKVKELTGLKLPDEFDWKKEEEIAANRAAVKDFAARLKLISTLSNSNVEDLALLKSKVEELRTSEAGAKIGTAKNLVSQYIALEEKISELTVSIPVAESFAQDMLALLAKVDAAKDTGYTPQPFVHVRATEYITQLKAKAVEVKRFDNALNGVVAKAQQNKAGQPLETVVKSLLSASEADLAESLANARAETTAKSNEDLAQAEREKIKAEAELELARIRAETEGAISKRNDLLANAAKQKLEKEFIRDTNSINTYLLPFISEGRNVRGAAEGKGPVSFSAIIASGALENTADGLASLSHVAKNGRPLGEFPINIQAYAITGNTTEGNVFNKPKYRAAEAYLEKAQSLLNKYGPLMVEKGMLAK